MSSFCAVVGVWDVFTNTHHSELAAQNDLFQRRRSGSSDVPGFEGSWVYYLGGGMFANFWKRDRPFTLLTKCLEIYHWRDATFVDAQGDLQMDETKVEHFVAQTLADPDATARIFARMHRLRDAQGIYAEGGCMDATREAPKFILPPHSDLLRSLT